LGWALHTGKKIPAEKTGGGVLGTHRETRRGPRKVRGKGSKAPENFGRGEGAAVPGTPVNTVLPNVLGVQVLPTKENGVPAGEAEGGGRKAKIFLVSLTGMGKNKK